MNILVINCGSSSLKYQLLNMENEAVLAKGLVERIGIEGAQVKHKTTGKDEVILKETMDDHRKALELVLGALINKEYGAVKSMDEIGAVGHRIVHGGEKFTKSVMIDNDVMVALEDCVDLAPLHNPANIMGIEACRELMPETPMVGVFDTAFHQTMPESSYMYAIPYELYEKHAIRRYGFHGTSHKYVTDRAADMLNKNKDDLNIITCHLGNGASIAAIKNGKVVDTSMGLTPLEGLAMGTRSGDMDPSIVTFVMEKENMSIEDMNNMLNKESGVYGVSGLSSDFRDLEIAMNDGNERAKLALDIFTKRVRKYIGAYSVLLPKVDGIIFTAGIGENSATIREIVCEGLESMGVEIDKDANDMRGKEAFISKESSQIPLLVIPTNEELMIARETLDLI